MDLLEREIRSAAAPSLAGTSTAKPPMDVLTVAKILLRRWYVTLFGGALTAAAVLGIVRTVEPTYESMGSFLVGGPDLRGEGPADTGVLAHISSAEALIDGLTTEASRATLTVGGETTSYRIEPSSDGAVLTIEAIADRAEDAVATAANVTEAIHLAIRRQQDAADVPAEQRTNSRTLRESSIESVSVLQQPQEDVGTVIRYAADASILHLQPPGALPNPYASSTFTIRVLEERLTAPLVYASVVEDRRTEFVIGQRDRDAAPILYVQVTGHDPDEVQATFSAAVDRVRAELDARQVAAGVSQSAFMVLEPLSIPPAPTMTSTNLKRPMVAIIVLGGMATVALAVGTDHVVAALRRRRRGDQGIERDAPA